MRTFSGNMVVNGQLTHGVLIFSSIVALVRKIHFELPLLVLSGTFSLCYGTLGYGGRWDIHMYVSDHSLPWV